MITHQRFQPSSGLQYVRVKFKPPKGRARWWWAVKVKDGVYNRLSKDGEPWTPTVEKTDEDGEPVYVKTIDALIGTPLEERPAGMNVRYGELEEL